MEEKVEKSKAKQKKFYDKKANTIKLSVGDKVLVKKNAFDGIHNIEDRFEQEVHTVIAQPRVEIPVFKLKSDDRVRTLHRYLIFLVSDSDQGEKTTEEERNQDEEEDEQVVPPSKQTVIEEETESEDESGFGFVDYSYRGGEGRPLSTWRWRRIW